MKLLVDMNLSPRWVDLLTQSQFEAVHWSRVGSPHALDQEIMAYAAKHGYVVLTNDLDFGAILAVTHGEKPSVVEIRSDNLSPDVIGVQTIRAMRQLAEQLQEGALINIDPLRTRVRLLPLKQPTASNGLGSLESRCVAAPKERRRNAAFQRCKQSRAQRERDHASWCGTS